MQDFPTGGEWGDGVERSREDGSQMRNRFMEQPRGINAKTQNGVTCSLINAISSTLLNSAFRLLLTFQAGPTASCSLTVTRNSLWLQTTASAQF